MLCVCGGGWEQQKRVLFLFISLVVLFDLKLYIYVLLQ